MAVIIYALGSMLFFGAAAAAMNKAFNKNICPVCAAVAGTWLLMLVLRFLEYPISVPLLAMLIGGSVVGIAYTLEKKLSLPRSRMIFKSVFIPVGFIAAYGMVAEDWIMAFGALLALLVIVGIFLSRRGSATGENAKELAKKLDECC